LLLVAVLVSTGACKPDLSKLTRGEGGEGGEGANGGNEGGNGGQTEGGTGGTKTGKGGSTNKAGASATGGSVGNTGGSSVGGSSVGGSGVGGSSVGGSSVGGSSVGGSGVGGTTACTLPTFVPGDPPSLHYAFDTQEGDIGATLIGAPTFTATGRIGGAIVLNATSYVQLPVDVVKSMDYMTVAAWVRLTSNSSGTLFDFGTGAENHFYLRLGGGSGVTYGAQILGGAIHETATTYVMPTSVWKHVALTVGDGKASLYIDGLNVRTTTNFTVSPSALGSTAGNFIGHTNTDTSAFYGNIDDFRIYPRVLTREEVENLAFPGKDYIHFRFDEPCGTKAYDRSDNAIVAELPEGGTWTLNGRFGGGLTLNGANQFVKLPDNFLQACNDLTVAMWVLRGSSTTAYERLFAFGQDTKTVMTLTTAAGANPMQFSAKLNASDVRGVGEEQLLSDSPEKTPKRGIWSHIAVVLKSGSSSGSMYFDGILAATNPITIKPSDMGATIINTLGQPVYVSEPFYNGTIDDLRVACRAFTAPEIKILALGNSN
jgi:hypothetical protein